MEEVIKKVIYSNTFYEDLKDIYSYGSETFGEEMGNLFQEKILHSASGLSYMSLLHPECRQLQTKTQIYRNIILWKVFNHLPYQSLKNRSIAGVTEQSES